MSMAHTLKVGHVFEPALQDISLKRFRLRYCTYDDCYYLHWDDTVCLPLAKINGLQRGAYSQSGLQRYIDESTGEAYLSCSQEADSAQIEWRLDFSSCGLVVMNMQVKMSTPAMEDDELSPDLTFAIQGDQDVSLTPELGDFHTELPDLTGCQKLSITAQLRSSLTNPPLRFLLGNEDSTPPLDIIIDLMCPRPKEDIYCGEILLGLKFSPEMKCDDDKTYTESPSMVSYSQEGGVIMDCQPRDGQLQVHIVEGAGLIDENTHKPFNTIVKCDLLPDTGRFGTKHTSPRHNAYPTWTQNFIFNGVTRDDLATGGLEVILYDHRHFSSDYSIGGLRFCVPFKKDDRKLLLFSQIDDLSLQDRCRSLSPAHNSYSPFSSSPGDNSPLSQTELPPMDEPDVTDINLRLSKPKSKSMPHVAFSHTHAISSPVSTTFPSRFHRTLSPASNNNLSPSLLRKSQQDISDYSPGSSPKTSPLTKAKNLFRLSGSHLKTTLSPHSSPRGSPRSSPLFGRKKHKNTERENEFIQYWMEDVTAGEVNHWKLMLQQEGDWIYYWHSIRYKLTSVA